MTAPNISFPQADLIIEQLRAEIHQLIGTEYRDAAIRAWEDAETARDEARAAAGAAAEGVRSELATVQADTEAARDTALEHRNDAQTARDEAQAAAENTKIGSPAEGWVKADLHTDVRDSLSRADSALQSVPVATPDAPGTVQLAGDLEGTAQAPRVRGLADKSDVGHGHQVEDVDGLGTALSGAGKTAEWNQVSGKPSAFPPDGHGHEVDDVDGLSDALAGAGQTAQWGQVSGKPTTFQPNEHRHTADQIDNLDALIDQRARALIEANGPRIERVTTLPDTPDPNTLYVVVEP